MSTRIRTGISCHTPNHIKELIIPRITLGTKPIHVNCLNNRYIFFEKMRIAEGKPKNASRLKVERAGGWIATRTYVYEIQGQEEVCFEDGKGRLFSRRTGKVVKLG